MVFRLVFDAARRKWLMGAFLVFQLYIFFKIPWKYWPSSDGMAWTMAGAAFLTALADELFRSREIHQLPVSRRTLWLARWWLSMTALALMAQLATIFAYWEARSHWPSVDYVVLSLIFAVLYCGCAMALQASAFERSGDEPATFVSTITFAPILIGFIAAPFLLAPYLPHSFAEMGPASAIVMLVMAAFTAHGYRHTPAIDARPHMRLARRVPSAHEPAPAVVLNPAGFAGRLTGLALVVWEESRKQLITFSSLIAIGVACWAIASRFRPVPALSEFLRLAAVMPFTSSRPVIAEPIVLGAIIVVVTVMEPGMVANIRSLRTLPISSARLACIPAGLGLVSAAMLWVVLLALHGFLAATLPASLRRICLSRSRRSWPWRTRFVSSRPDILSASRCLASRRSASPGWLWRTSWIRVAPSTCTRPRSS